MKFFKKIQHNWFKIFIVLMVLFLLLNRGARTIFRHILDEKRLKTAIVKLEKENASLKNQIYNLENNPAYLVRAVKNEYKVIGDGEIEYRFQTK